MSLFFYVLAVWEGYNMSEPLPLYSGAVSCVQSGFCCKQAPCPYGEWDAVKQQCKYLEEHDNGIQYNCGKYAEILARPQSEWAGVPAFGAGCCNSLFNEDRDRILELGITTEQRGDGRIAGDSVSDAIRAHAGVRLSVPDSNPGEAHGRANGSE